MPAPKQIRFFYHYNRPATKKAGVPMISLHYDGKCHIVRDIRLVKLSERSRTTMKRQPNFVMTGKANKIDIVDGVATLS